MNGKLNNFIMQKWHDILNFFDFLIFTVMNLTLGYNIW
jgi:hypothetical protein